MGLLSKKDRQLITDPLSDNNPITVQVLGICSALAITAELEASVVMSVSVLFVMGVGNVVISMIRNIVPSKIRIIVQLTVIATLVIIVDLVLKAFAYELSKTLSENEILEFNPILNTKFEQISEVILNSFTRAELKSILNISPEKLRNIKGVQPGIENILKTLPGVSINNEMSTQYSVRGGNFDENLVYVNGIEIYRPFLIRSGQQEGLSFVNSEMIEDIKFSSGGFEAIYGDKMSSVLDIKYKSPDTNKYNFNSSLLGGSFISENITKNNKISNILGLRYRNNSLIVNSKETNSNFRPSFFDLQNFLKIKLNSKINISSITNFSINRYNFKPLNRQTNFGTLDDPLALIIFYNGEEKDKYSTFFNSFSLDFKPNQRDIYTFNTSFYNTNEKEYFDILAQYNLAEVNSNIGDEDLGEVEFSQGVGSQLNHARNNLSAQIFNMESKLKLIRNKNEFNFSLKFTLG